jgi:hypothetical protein
VDRKEQRRVEAAKRTAKQPLRNKMKKAELLMKTLAEKRIELEARLADSDIHLKENKDKFEAVLTEKASTDQEL